MDTIIAQSVRDLSVRHVICARRSSAEGYEIGDDDDVAVSPLEAIATSFGHAAAFDHYIIDTGGLALEISPFARKQRDQARPRKRR